MRWGRSAAPKRRGHYGADRTEIVMHVTDELIKQNEES